jgi:glycosyltransferase involved in cell wall biosynthesis
MLPFEVVLVEGLGADALSDSRPIRDLVGDNMPASLGPRIRRLLRRAEPLTDDATNISRFLRQRRIDVVLAEYGTTSAAITDTCARAGIPLIAHFHGFDASRRSVIEAYEMSYRRMFAYASSVVAVSKYMRERLIRLGCPPEKLIVSPCGPSASFSTVVPAPHSNTIVAVGRLVEKKAPELLIKAFHKALSKRPELSLTIVGDGPLRSSCENLIRSLGLESHVSLTGVLSPDEIRDLFSRSFLLAQHSVVASDGDSEGTPVAIMEAGAASLPVVATRHGGIPDVIQDGVTGLLVAEGDVDGMAAAIATLAADRPRAREMGSRARERIQTEFSIDKHIGKIAAAILQATRR